MSRKERRTSSADRIRELIARGDHRAARAAARAILDDPAQGEDDRAAAASALASLSPERGAALAGVIGLGAMVALTVFVLLRS